MKHYTLELLSKNKKVTKKFFQFLKKNIYIDSIKKCVKNTRKKVITILKSPHVNKVAQEQFELKTFITQAYIYSHLDAKLIYGLKKFKNEAFSNHIIKIKILINKISLLKPKPKQLNPDKFKLNILNNVIACNNKTKQLKTKKNHAHIIRSSSSTQNLTKVLFVIKVFDLYGELLNKNNV